MAFSCDPKDPRSPPWLKSICRNLRWAPLIFILGLLLFAYLTVVLSLGLRYHLASKGEWIAALIEVLLSTILAGGAIWSFLVAVFKDSGSPRGGRGGDYELGGDGEEGESLMRSHQAGSEGEEGARIGLFNAPIPGQPQYPARSGRQQLADLQRLPSTVQRRSNIWVKSSGESRWCAKCDAPKPDRTHHCSSCQRCVLRMDHHCPWLANRCVGLRNHKAFFLFVSYTALFCAYACQETARALLRYVEYENNGFESSPISWAIVLFLGFIFGASLVPFAGYHAWLICKNRTTIESMEGSGRIRLRVKRDNAGRGRVEERLRGIVEGREAGRGGQRRREDSGWRSDEHLSREERRALKQASKLNVYDVGAASNWRQIMGDVWYLWFVPIGEPQSDGFSFLVNTKTLQELEQVTASIRTRSDQLPHRESREREEEGEEGEDDSVYGGEASRFGYQDDQARATRGEEADTGMDRKPGQKFKGAHGEMEWGEAPKKSFVLFGVDDEDEQA